MRRPIDINQIPPAPQASILNPQKGYFSVILPVARTNLVTNPSLETGTSGWGIRGTDTNDGRTTTKSYHGAYSFFLTPTTGATSNEMNAGPAWGSITPTANAIYAVSCKVLGATGVKYRLYVENSVGPVELFTRRFVGTGQWQWIWLIYQEGAAPAGSRNYVVAKDNNRDGNTFYVDGLQVELITDGILAPTTYIDGEQQGLLPNQNPPPYGWNGTPHASTSYRLATTRAGGRVVNLDQYKYKVAGYLGLGLTMVANIGTPPASTDGAQFQTTIARSRSFVINGFVDSTTDADMDRQRSLLASAFGPDGASPRQPVCLIFQKYDCERPIGAMGRIIASYERGLEGQTNNDFREDVPLTFTQWLPAILAGDSGASLTVQLSVTNANGIIQRSASGVWSALGTGVNANTVTALAYGADGKLYAGGDFTLMGGVANTVRIAYWDGSAWNAMGTGASTNTVRCLLVTPDGTVYAGGTFAAMGGVANTAGIAKWNGAAWSAVGTGVTAGTVDVRALVYGTDGNVYATGYFTTMGGVANTSRIAKWNGTVWAPLSTGLDTGGEGMTVGLDGSIYVVGAFATAGGVAAVRAAKWDGSAFTALSTGLSALAFDVTTGPDGRIYAAGSFLTAGGVTVNRIAAWNGAGWQPLSSGADNDVRHLLFVNNLLFAGGQFTTIGTITPPDRIAAWNGSAWTLIDANLPGATIVNAIAMSRAGVLTLGFSTNGTAVTGAVTTAANTGTARAYPAVTITGPTAGTALLYQLRNVTTGKTLFLNYTISLGETVTIQTSPNGTNVFSSQRGNISSIVLPGSSPDFALEIGNNSISFLADTSTVTATMRWAIGYQSAADLTE